MNDKDKEAFEKWLKNSWAEIDSKDYPNLLSREAWQAACEYKQSELAYNIYKIELEKSLLGQKIDILKLEYDKLTEWVSKYKAENTKLRECVMFYAELTPVNLGLGYQAKQCLKELGY